MGLSPASFYQKFPPFFDYMKQAGMKPVIGFYLDSNPDRKGSISFGDYNVETYGKKDHQVTWLNVDYSEDKYYWGHYMNYIKINDQDHPIADRVGVFDTGTSFIIVPPEDWTFIAQ